MKMNFKWASFFLSVSSFKEMQQEPFGNRDSRTAEQLPTGAHHFLLPRQTCAVICAVMGDASACCINLPLDTAPGSPAVGL